MTRMTVATAIVRFLKNQYSARDGKEQRLIAGISGIFGHGNVAGLGQALAEESDRSFPLYQPKNEQAMVHTAIAFAKANNRLSALACTSSIGPGATNMVTGAATATINRLPVLLLPGDIFSTRIPSPVLQQLEHPHSMDISVNDCFKPVSRYWDRIHRPEQILRALPEAMRVLADPQATGAVTICLPQDVQAEVYDFPESFFEKHVYSISRPTCSKEDIQRASEWIRKAQRPMIIAGGGVAYSDAYEFLAEFCSQTRIPLGLTQAGKGCLLASHLQNLGALGVTGTLAANKIAKEADLILAVGTRLSDFTTASHTQFQNPNLRFINLNICASDAHKNRGFPLVGDAKAILWELKNSLADYRMDAGYVAKIENAALEWREARDRILTPPTKKDAHLTQTDAIRILNDELDENSTIVHAAGGLPGDLHKLWMPKSHDDYHSEYGYSCMGYEIAGALGVKMARPEREVYALLGDGSYLMMNHEILTAIQEGLKITVIVFDNHGYQCIHNLQKNCGGQSFGNEFRYRTQETGRLDGEFLAIDFIKNAESLGAVTYYADHEESLIEAVKSAKNQNRTALIYIPIVQGSPVPSYSWWDVPVSEESKAVSVRTARQGYQLAKVQQRILYA